MSTIFEEWKQHLDDLEIEAISITLLPWPDKPWSSYDKSPMTSEEQFE